ncbi:uncharacterized protein LOC131018689 [Salvia miltiorrhiza]|uniref:uncharacterized protein LOC131018689 n=1 Tax=Salvia miltiorrhiza TaxID=226208 RepID=UPI0025AC9379|nr:uncharacterized protein LOC131018689 [Salvia miltiorrhiza]
MVFLEICSSRAGAFAGRPFFFLFRAEALFGLLRQAETQHLIHRARLCRTAPRISHLLFADACIIFGRANANEVGVIRNILEKYEGVSGQKVNLDKSSISFSGGIVDEVKNELAGMLGFSVGRSKTEMFRMLVDRTRKKSKYWKMRFLSGTRIIILIKAVLQSIPSYLMSCFVIPTQICQRLNSVAARFFWGKKQEERRIHWRSWKKLCTSKFEGGLGFQDLCRFN